jgi:D-tyrosyl-tRNA(Tyr) deacylase
MVALIQRVSFVRLSVNGELISEIGPGLLIFLGVGQEDTEVQSEWLSRKVSQLRILADQEGKMNKSVLDLNQEIMVVSQFTLLADASQGHRPSYTKAAPPEKANSLYQDFIGRLSALVPTPVKTGIFGADMKIELLNDGPVTLHLDTGLLMKPKIG